MNSAPVLGTSPSSPTFTFALGRHYSQDCSECSLNPSSILSLAVWSWVGSPCWATATSCLASSCWLLLPPGSPRQSHLLAQPRREGCGTPHLTTLLTLWPTMGGFAGSIKAGRRSSYLLAITTERSKSCDDGLNTFREESRALR